MTDLVSIPMREMVERLQYEMSKFPQVELPTEHYFADGMYCRVLPRRKDVLIVGKVHKKEHFYMVVSGCVRVTTDEGVKDLPAFSMVVSKPGTKRAVLALEDSICLTVHRTDSRNLEEIEAELIEPDNMALFDSYNKPKELT